MQTAIIIQARLGSTRLPCKVLLPLPSGRSVIEQVIDRCLEVEGVDQICVAHPYSDRPLYDFLESCGRGELSYSYDGDENDVLGRYARIAEVIEADIIVRITADCPMLDPSVVSELIKLRERHDSDYASNAWPARSYAKGLDCEVFTIGALRRAAHEAVTPYEREHVTIWFQREPSITKTLLKNMTDDSHDSVTLDTIEDYRKIWNRMRSDLTRANFTRALG